ncbi:50S ribosomal protein L25 [Candidatus Saccharibacteria bacterium]|nr:50S ribosomal protein L25 [Candidatus Saccharibacteria bacterium]
MGDKINLALDKRVVQGKKVKQLRVDGIVPVVIYGPGIEPINAQVEYNLLAKVYRKAGTHAPVQVTIDGKKKIALIKEVDVDPVKGTIRHVSFHAVKATDPVVAEVPVRLVGEGESEAERSGLVVLQNLEKIEVRALPMDLPEAIEVSVLDLKEAGEKVTLADATLPEGVEFVERDSGHGDQAEDEKQHVTDQMVASVWEPSALAASNEAAAGDADGETEVQSDNGEAEDSSPEATDQNAN